MDWLIVNFGKHKGKTLPQILFSDPDWFFEAIEKEYFKNRGILSKEADDLYRKACNIKIPSAGGPNMIAEYIIDPSRGKFFDMKLVPEDKPPHEGSSVTFRKSVIDLSVPRQIASYDKLGYSRMLSSVKFYLFGSGSVRMTKKRCEEFFENSDNFTNL
ncbi:hypothetical protein KAX06_08040 [candidate division WOR-3 bacterium]|nr:hypothetical protein [candidate division WOR-3 bacterium]